MGHLDPPEQTSENTSALKITLKYAQMLEYFTAVALFWLLLCTIFFSHQELDDLEVIGKRANTDGDVQQLDGGSSLGGRAGSSTPGHEENSQAPGEVMEIRDNYESLTFLTDNNENV